MLNWKTKRKITATSALKRRRQIIASLLKSRGLTSSTQIDNFFNPPSPQELTAKDVAINKKSLDKAISKIKKAVTTNQSIIIYGDYDADGITATAILWETLHQLKANVTPFIPDRFRHGYGLSKKGIDDILKTSHRPLIITVDNGIVAHLAVNYANQQGLEVIITDHHVALDSRPKALSIVHTTLLSGAGVSWFLSKAIWSCLRSSAYPLKHLELAAIGTIADMVPLLGSNRAIAKTGLAELAATNRVGLLELFHQAGINQVQQLASHQVNFQLVPRLNAAGRLNSAMDALRLLCTTNKSRAKNLAAGLNSINLNRQTLTTNQLLHAKKTAKKLARAERILILGHKSYHEGVIGLIAGRLMEEFYLPTIVLSQGKTTSKASARSIKGFNIIQALRKLSHLLVDVGGHPMAAGFTIENKHLPQFTKKLQALTRQKLSKADLKKTLNIDCQVELSDLNWSLYKQLEKFHPFGMANFKPVFATKEVTVVQVRSVGQDRKHLKMDVTDSPASDRQGSPGVAVSAIGFRLGEYAAKLNPGDTIDLAYTLEENTWNGKKSLQLNLKDIRREK